MKRLLILWMLFAAGLSAMAQSSAQGKEFWFSFMHNGYKYYNSVNSDWVELTVMISAKRACSGTIRLANDPTQYIPFSVGNNSAIFVDVPEAWAYNEDNEEEVDNKALVLSATDTVSVFISNVANYSFDASFVLPVESLGAEYIIQTDKQSNSDNFQHHMRETSSFLIVAVEDDTEVEITPSVATLKGHGAAVPYRVSMSAGQTYFVRSNCDSEWRDLSGSTVFALDGKRIAVFNGNTVTLIPGEARNGRDHIFEQAMPVDSWGKQFVITPSCNRARDMVKITSSSDDNFIYRDGEEIAIIGYTDSYEFELLAEEGSCYIETSEPSAVYLYHTSWEDPFEPSGARLGDPSMVWIPPIEQKIDDITFCMFDNDHAFAAITHQYVNIVVHRLDTHNVYLDGERIPSSEFQCVQGSSDFSFVRKAVEKGTHHLSCESGLTAHVYGFGQAIGYAYCVGTNVLTLTGKLYVNGLWSGSYRDGLYMCKGEDVRLRVVANYAVEQVDWMYDDGQTAQGIETTRLFAETGDYQVLAHVKGINTLTLEPVDDTMSFAIHVGEPFIIEETIVGCDSIELLDSVYYDSFHYESVGTNIYGCDSTYFIDVTILGIMPTFEIHGDHWPIGGSETHISESEYTIELDNPLAVVDTVLWEVDCENWRLEPHGKGETCTMKLYSFLLEPVMLRATVINGCATITKEFFIQTSYFDVEENNKDKGWFTIMPNPNSGDFTLHFDRALGQVEVTIYDEKGRQVACQSVRASDEFHWHLEELPSGMYFVKAVSDGKSLVRKVMINR